MRDLMRSNDDKNLRLPFGGKTIVFGRNFRQILPMIPKGTTQDIVNASLNSSYLWQHYEILRLTVNMRLQSMTTDSQVEDLKQFPKCILHVRNEKSKGTSDRCNMTKILPEFHITDYNDYIQGIIEAIYPN
ncbi:uncharacterized protein LOC130957450 [Arachis stenosperma]|uniref:uncharacterized protein LOC130957450 n=1 Tax=Arachis stenosperma TaxID=217475 RepID=UPI0025ACBBE6|nr:uncharacterized protein LOC130957450 [Arachis stenosperma]